MWRKSLTPRGVSPQSRSLFSASFQTFCLTAGAYLNRQKYNLVPRALFPGALGTRLAKIRTVLQSTKVESHIFVYTVPDSPSCRQHLRFGKRATKNMQLVLQHCCKTSCKATLRVLRLSSNISCTKTACWQVWTWVVKRATSLFNLFCNTAAKQIACFLLPVFPYL